MTRLRCPICGNSFHPSGSQSLPFCSDRCRQIDLGRWLSEGYSVPVVGQPDDEAESAGLPEDEPEE